MGTFSVQKANYRDKPALFLQKEDGFSPKIERSVRPKAPKAPQNIIQSQHINVSELISAFLSGKSQKTLMAYRQDLESFTRHLEVSSIDEAVTLLVDGGHGMANLTAIRFKDALSQQGLAPATINRHLSALRSLIGLAQTLGLVDWGLQVPNVKSQAFRDTRGVGIEGFKRLLGVAQMQRSPRKGARDTAVLRLLFDLALRRSEVAGLDYEDVDLAGSRVMVLGKGKTEKSPMTLPDPTREAINDWLLHRGEEPGALFHNCDRARKGIGQRLTGNGIYRMVCKLGSRALIKARPHGIRHAAITGVLDLMQGNVRVAQRFARHASPETTIRYDDNRIDLGGEASRKLAENAL